MHGLMQHRPLMISDLLVRASRHHGATEIVTNTVEGGRHRYTYRDAESRARQLARALTRLGMQPHDRIGTLAWNTYRHLELYYAVSGAQAICHTINPRLFDDQVAYIIDHAQDTLLFADLTFAELVGRIVPKLNHKPRAVVIMTEADRMPKVDLPAGVALHAFEDLLEAENDDFDWPVFDELSASSLCYTSATTGDPKGVLYSHRSTVLHALASAQPDAFGLRATDRFMPVVPMFHVNAWGTPYAAPMSGTALVMPGARLDGPSLQQLIEEERVTSSAGVPTVWLGLLHHLRDTGKRVDCLERLVIGGSACPELLISAFARDYGVRVDHAWGMTEMSPIGTFNRPKPTTQMMSEDEAFAYAVKQGRTIAVVDMKITDADGTELPWDGKSFGDLWVRGPCVCSSYFGIDDRSASHDAQGWFKTGDVATIDPHGSMEVIDRTKDVIKSGGEWISSITLENIAVGHPDIAEAAVIAAPHPRWGERPVLICVTRTGSAPDAASILGHFEGKVAKWWIPDAVLVVAELPHTATGKLKKTVLRDRYRDQFAHSSD